MKRVLVLFALAAAAPAFAQTPPVENKSDGKYAPPVQRMDITEDEEVTGEFMRPGDEIVGVRHKAKHVSLIKIRYQFIDEMIKSADNF